jgi:AraC-like DNA-binding protein
MIITLDAQELDSPYVQEISYGHTLSAGQSIRPAEPAWHLVIVCEQGKARCYLVGPLTTSGIATWNEGAEIIWIKFKLGSFMPHLALRSVLDIETVLPEASSRSFWLNGSAWQIPDYQNVDVFIDRLARKEILVRDPLVESVLNDQPHDLSPRTVRDRFLRTTGTTQSHIRQVERAQRAAGMLRAGKSILDTVHELGYYDQPHLTRALKQWVGRTPAQIIRQAFPPCDTPKSD